MAIPFSGTRLRLWPGVGFAAALLLAACGTLPVAPDKPVSLALADTQATRLGRATESLVRAHPGEAGMLALADGREAFAARARLAEAAERSIDVQTYIFHGDDTGTLMFDRLREAADRGVRVRLLLDDNNTVGLDPVIAMLTRHANIEVRLFNPFANRSFRLGDYLTDFSRLNRRMHNKSFTVDNQATVVGGRNIGDEYFEAGQGTTFADLDVIAIGGVVREVSEVFDRYWNSAPAYLAAPLLAGTVPADEAEFRQRVKQIRESPEAAAYVRALGDAVQVGTLLAGEAQIEWARARLIYDEPEKVIHPTDRHDLQMLPDLEATLGKPGTTLDLVSPYFVPGEAFVHSLQTLSRRGVQVRILTNSLAATDVSAVHAGYAKWRKDLLGAGRAVARTEAIGRAAEAHAGGRPQRHGRQHGRQFEGQSAREDVFGRPPADLHRLVQPRPALGTPEHRDGPRHRQPGVRRTPVGRARPGRCRSRVRPAAVAAGSGGVGRRGRHGLHQRTEDRPDAAGDGRGDVVVADRLDALKACVRYRQYRSRQHPPRRQSVLIGGLRRPSW